MADFQITFKNTMGYNWNYSNKSVVVKLRMCKKEKKPQIFSRLIFLERDMLLKHLSPTLLSSSYPQDPTEFSKNPTHLHKKYLFIKGLPVRQTVLSYPWHTSKNYPLTYPTLERYEVSYFRLCKPDIRGNKGTISAAGYLESSKFRNKDTFM